MANDVERRLGIDVEATDNASGKLSAVKRGIAGIQGSSGVATRSFGTFVSSVERGAGKLKTSIGGAVSHAKGQLLGIARFGAIALGVGGLLSFGGAFTASLDKATQWGAAIEKLQPITHGTAQELSGLLALAERYNVDATKLVTIAGFESKAVEGIALKTKGAATFQKQYGFSIVDTHGKVKSFTSMLSTFSDYYRTNTDRAQANAAAAKLFGRSYTNLIPILNLGARGIRAAQEEAASLGLTLTQDNVVALAKAREATRKWGDVIGGLELQLSLTFLPTLTDLTTAVSAFVEGHRGDIITFFKNAIAFGKDAATTIGNVAGALSSAWSVIPAPMRELLLKTLVGDRIVKFAFGFSPIKTVLTLGTDVLGGIAGAVAKSAAGALLGAGIGKAFVQPVFVTNPGFGGGGGGPGGPSGPSGPAEPSAPSILDWVKWGAAAATVGGGIVAGGLAIKDWFNQQLNIHPPDISQVLQNPFGPLTQDQARQYIGAGSGPGAPVPNPPNVVGSSPTLNSLGAQVGGASPEDRALREPLIAANSKLQSIKDAGQTTNSELKRMHANAHADQERVIGAASYQRSVLERIKDQDQSQSAAQRSDSIRQRSLLERIADKKQDFRVTVRVPVSVVNNVTAGAITRTRTAYHYSNSGSASGELLT